METPQPSEMQRVIGLVCGDSGCKAVYAHRESEGEAEKSDHKTRHTPPEQTDCKAEPA
jgi:hypothetical protein